MAASLENITRAIREIDPPTFLTVFGPAIDGSIVANDPQHNLREHGDLFRELDLLVGVTKNEAFHLLGNQDVTQGMDKEKRDSIYRTLVQNLFRYHRNEILAAITDEYTDWKKPLLQKEDARNAVMRALGDGLFVTPVINAARIHARPKRPFDTDDSNANYGKGLGGPLGGGSACIPRCLLVRRSSNSSSRFDQLILFKTRINFHVRLCARDQRLGSWSDIGCCARRGFALYSRISAFGTREIGAQLFVQLHLRQCGPRCE